MNKLCIASIPNLAKQIIDEGGSITPILISSEETVGTGLTNPSIIQIGDELLVNLRCVNYTLIHSDKRQKYWSRWGPLTYGHPENHMSLRTTNYLCKINKETLLVDKWAKIDTSKLDIPPMWDFHGLEDARLTYWNGKLYGIGVRRDVKPNGEGRMEFQEIEYSFEGTPYAKEVSRNRIQPPIHLDSYCEKNWMPILDKPFHFVKWSNPTEVVVADLETNKSEQVHIGEKYIYVGRDLRGGSQLIKWNDGWLSVTHELVMMEGNNEHHYKDAYYFSRFVHWDSNWNIIKTSSDFSFLDGRIEFTTGMIDFNDEFVLCTFGWSDSSGYIAKIPKTLINKLLNIEWNN